jgi:hypothetical protein
VGKNRNVERINIDTYIKKKSRAINIIKKKEWRKGIYKKREGKVRQMRCTSSSLKQTTEAPLGQKPYLCRSALIEPTPLTLKSHSGT